MKLRSCLLSCIIAVAGFAGSALAATPSAPAYLDVAAVQFSDWRSGISLSFPADEKICRAKYGNKKWESACQVVLGEEGEIVGGITISPAEDGVWRRSGTRSISFVPKKSLKPNTAYTIDLGGMKVPASAKLSKTMVKLSTRPTAVTMTDSNVWVDPSERGAHMLTANMRFLYPVADPSHDLFIVKKIADANGLKLGALQQTWNSDKDAVTLTVPLLSLPSDKSGVEFSVTGYRPYAYENGELKISQNANAGWVVPVLASPFTVQNVSLSRSQNENLDKVWELVVKLNMHVRSDVLAQHMKVGQLPLYNTEGAVTPYDWNKAGYIPNSAIENSTPLRLVPMQPDDFASNTLRYRVSPNDGQFIFVKIFDEFSSTAGQRLSRPWLAVLKAYPFGSSLALLQPGSILPLRGDKKLDIQASGLDAIEWKAERVRKPFLAMLGALDGTYENPLGWEAPFGYDVVSENAASGSIALPKAKPGEAQFAALDLSPVLENAGPDAVKGMLRVSLSGVKEGRHEAYLDRFIVVTDLGLVLKQTRSDELEAFACSLSQGVPAGSIKVSVLSKNGSVCAEAVTDGQGHAVLPSLKGLRAEREPVAVIAESSDGDLAWISLRDYSRRADYSSYEVGGRSSSAEGINAFVFSQRGVYRPGETLCFANILRRTDWKALPEGMPLKASLLDPAGREVFAQNFKTEKGGLNEFSWASSEGSPTGRYRLEIRLPGDDGELLGTASVLLEEFIPETMRMSAKISPAKGKGWLCIGSDTSAEVRAVLKDLYGAPGADRRITAHLVSEPADLSSFSAWPGYTFYDPASGTRYQEKELAETRTDAEGNAVISLPSEFALANSSSYTVELRGFEPGGGRSVTAAARSVLSPRKYLVGYKTDGNIPRMDYIPKGRNAVLSLIAVSPDLELIDPGELKYTLSERRYVSNLVSDKQGNFRYAEAPVDKEIASGSMSLNASGASDWKVYTDLPGEYVLKITDAGGELVASAPYTVVGERLRNSSETTDSGMRLNLSRDEYRSGDTIEMALTVPYDGTGLITIERDYVAAHQWFKAKAGDTVQSIKLPAGFEGKGYVTVSYARSADSEDIYLNPYMCAAAPFNAGTERRNLGLKIEAPEKALPGSDLKVRVSARQSAKAVVYAVDEGILQLTRYALPDPLGYLLKDRALDVATLQAFDLVMPDHGILKSRMPGFGGGDSLASSAMAGMQNPFKRSSEPPLVWWSGIVDVPAGGTDISIPLPDYCGTTLRVMAVGCTDILVGSAKAEVIARGSIVITPQLPLAAAPGDTFEASVAVAAPDGARGPVTVSMKADEALVIDGPDSFEISEQNAREALHTFRVTVKDIPGDAGIVFTASDSESKSERRASLSVRPAVSRSSRLVAGKSRGSFTIQNDRDMLPFEAVTTASVSPLPLPAMRALNAYLDSWSFGCTEQLISKAFPYALIRKNPSLLASKGRSEDDVIKMADERIQAAIAAIMERRTGMGRVSLWPGGADSPFATVYAADFLMTLREEGIGVPMGLVQSVCDAAEIFAGGTVSTDEDARLKAYACWVLSREGRVMTRELESLDRYVAENPKTMKGDIAQLFMAASREILHMPWSFDNLNPALVPSGSQFDVLSVQAFNAILTARYYPHVQGDSAGDLVDAALTAVAENRYNTFSSAQAARAVLTVSPRDADSLDAVTLSCSGHEALAQTAGSAIVSLDAPLCRTFAVDAPNGAELYWMLATEGFDRTPPTEAEMNGMEISRVYLDATGTPVTEVKQGDILTVEIEARSYGGEIQQCVIADLLPGGLEQVMSEQNDDDDEYDSGIMFSDKREDRMILFTDIDRDFRYAYKVKAVTKGTFVIPSVTAEAMYDRTRRARSASGTMTIK